MIILLTSLHDPYPTFFVALQGAGSGGITALTQIILSDLVSLQERGKYNGLFQL